MDRGSKLNGRDLLRILKRMSADELRLPIVIASSEDPDQYTFVEDVRVERVPDPDPPMVTRYEDDEEYGEDLPGTIPAIVISED